MSKDVAVAAVEQGKESRIREVLGTRSLYPLLLAAYPALHLYEVNCWFVPFEAVYVPLAVSLLPTGVVYFLLSRFAITKREAPILCLLLVILFFGYGVFCEGLPRWFPFLGFFVRHRFTIPVWLLLGFCGIVWTLLKKPRAPTLFLNCFSVGLIALSLLSLLAKAALQNDRSTNPTSANLPVINTTDRKDLPDIYYIILDGYGRQDVFERFYAFDNKPFLDELRHRGFWIADQSKSNYLETELSIPSSLNLQYLQDLMPRGGQFDHWYTPPNITNLMNHAQLLGITKKLGYTTVNVSSEFSLSDNLSGADINFGYNLTQAEFNYKLASSTLLNPILPPMFLLSGAELVGRFEHLESASKLRGPKFVFAHILSPHPPYQFDASGHPTPSDWASHGWTDRKGYIGQVQFDNRKVLEALDTILANSARTPIIVIQGDHGPSLIDSVGTKAWNADWPPDQFAAREPILNAYLVPEKVRNQLYPSITPVNSFRAILRAAFGENLPQLPDKTFFSTSNAPLDLRPVPNK